MWCRSCCCSCAQRRAAQDRALFPEWRCAEFPDEVMSSGGLIRLVSLVLDPDPAYAGRRSYAALPNASLGPIHLFKILRSMFPATSTLSNLASHAFSFNYLPRTCLLYNILHNILVIIHQPFRRSGDAGSANEKAYLRPSVLLYNPTLVSNCN